MAPPPAAAPALRPLLITHPYLSTRSTPHERGTDSTGSTAAVRHACDNRSSPRVAVTPSRVKRVEPGLLHILEAVRLNCLSLRLRRTVRAPGRAPWARPCAL